MKRRFLSTSQTIFVCAFVAFAGVIGLSSLARADSSPAKKVEIAAAVSMTGDLQPFGGGSLEGIQFALEEANASGIGPQIELKIYDNASSPERARENARRIVASPAILVLGPMNSVTSLAAGPEFARAGLPSISATATSDLITENATTFRMLMKNSDQGEFLANYLVRVFNQRRAAVMVMDNGLGRTLETGFRRVAEQLGIEATYYVFKNGENIEEKLREATAALADRPVVLATQKQEGARILTVLRRLGHKGPYLGGDAFGVENFNSYFAGLPEEKEHTGYFCESLYGLAPMLLDSANAELLSFSERFQARFGHEPGWATVAGYDAARLVIETLRGMDKNASETPAMRAAALKYLLALNDERRAPLGLLGPLAFDSGRGRQAAERMGRFVHGHFESAPVQIVPAPNPHQTEISSGAVFETRPGKYSRFQQVIYSGVFLNEIMWMDPARSTFAADFYVWLRFAQTSGVDAADPREIKFPDLVSGGAFDREHPVEQREMADGTSYRLWRVQGEFRNSFDLHRYPFDRQALSLRFFNARAAADHIVYALDQSASTFDKDRDRTIAAGVAPAAFRMLSQWHFVGSHHRRENFVAKSSLGDPFRIGRVNYREFSGYAAIFDLQRRSLSTVIKNLLPLLLMTCILYASLHFPPTFVQTKIGVALTAVLTGVVLLNSVNTQLGSIGYTVAVEWAFYVFFALGLFHIVSVLITERLREQERRPAADKIDHWTRIIFIGAVVAMALVGFFQFGTS
ncbi:MAG TPA: ABC transporter substrate-binding protein [Chthoniobacterales bacterium]|nr:ABC transporter substrate-binding protein [Chthoniobacterales bacterium]